MSKVICLLILLKALENNPRDAKTLGELGETLILARRYAKAVEVCRLAQSIDPLFGDAALWEVRSHRTWKGTDGLADADDRLRLVLRGVA